MRDRDQGSSNHFLSLHCRLPEYLEEDLSAFLWSWPVLGSEIGDRSEKGVRVTVFLAGNEGEASVELAAALEEFGATEIKSAKVANEDWLVLYRKRLQAFSIGDRWWIDPHPDTPSPVPAGRHRLVVEPRMAFGSGSHESTGLILLALEELDVAGADVLDIGTGSGILALAAEHLGARSVVALDIDPQAVFVARQIAAQQEWRSKIRFLLGPISTVGPQEFDTVLCNMIFSEFRSLLGDIRRLTAASGTAVLSGLLVTELKEVEAELRSVSLRVDGERILGEWASVNVVHASGRVNR